MNENEGQDADGVEIFRSSSEDEPGERSTSSPFTAEADAAAAQEPHIGDAPVAPKPRSRARQVVGFGVAAVVLLGVGAGGGALAVERFQASEQATAAHGTNGFGQTQTGSGSTGSSGSSGSSSGNGFDPNNGTFGGFGFGSGPGSSGGSSSSGGFGSQGSTSDSGGTTATAAQQVGVVTIVSDLGYQSGEAAGTGIVLTSSGKILTNNHVIAGSTAIKVTVESTGRTYTANVVGTDASDDVAVLQLKDASGLTTAKLAGTPAAVGDKVTAVGNAGGTGTLSQASGSVTDLDQSITTQAEGSAASEDLTGLIETDAGIVAGDSGGPLENSNGAVVGIDTAASSGTAQVQGYAIPISTAVQIAGAITSGSTSSRITLGYPAFLGIEVDPSASVQGAGVAQALNGTPAASAGITAGDVITAVDGKTVGSASALTALLKSYSPGDSVKVAFTDQSGASHTVTVTLTAGPAN
ncbi:MAG TPA: trypsin-like peptidase domain-containing protein [Amnibacterium sp.]|uniref:S1C family serine protease n=1 Tax=Amnibacterium sp. TaxID=1872496 RepID=UPI002F959FDF